MFSVISSVLYPEPKGDLFQDWTSIFCMWLKHVMWKTFVVWFGWRFFGGGFFFFVLTNNIWIFFPMWHFILFEKERNIKKIMCLSFIFLKRCSKKINLYFQPIFSIVPYFIFTLKLLQNNKCAMIIKSNETKAGIHLYQVICCPETIPNNTWQRGGQFCSI